MRLAICLLSICVLCDAPARRLPAGRSTGGSPVTAQRAVDRPASGRRALIIGIDDYTASTLGPPRADHRGWPDLKGAATDAALLRDLIVAEYGFRAEDVVTLTNQQATRAAILQSIERHLLAPASKGDVVFYYFAGHGSQVPNLHSDEPDRLDESIVPADSRTGALDIRDKELRPLFNRILDRGAHLTLILDHCHSGSGFRGTRRVRGIERARPIADPQSYGPRPEHRGALVLASAQDLDTAWEVRGDDGRMHGAFTWAWLRAMRDAGAGEPAQDTFLRAQARMRAETPDQVPVMLGDAAARQRPFLGTRIHRTTRNRPLVAVEKVRAGGDVVLQGGWVNGLSTGSELRGDDATRLRVTAILGLGRSIARVESGAPVRTGTLLEVVRPRAWWNNLGTGTPAPYRLALLREKTQELVRDSTVFGGETYTIVLRLTQSPAETRYYYVFVLDTAGQRHVLYPRGGSVENRFPIGAARDVPLGAASAFEIAPPYGLDTYFLLSTDEPLPNPAILTWDDMRAPLALNRWSVERVPFLSVAPRACGVRQRSEAGVAAVHCGSVELPRAGAAARRCGNPKRRLRCASSPHSTSRAHQRCRPRPRNIPP